MRRIFLIAGLALCAMLAGGNLMVENANAQQKTESQPAPETVVANPADVASIESIVNAAYDSISGPAGKKRDWNRVRSLFMPGARLIPTGKNAEGKTAAQVLDVDGYFARANDYLEKNGFFEKEIARRTEQFGHIAHVFSTYESRHKADDPKPFARGINSIQLMYDGKRWWIVTIYWQQESADDPIPEKYLDKVKN
jgi:hypothetical protein